MSTSIAKEFGMKLACALQGASRSDLDVAAGAVEALDASTGYKQALCGLARDFYDACGQAVTIQRNMYDLLSKSAQWDPEFDAASDCVLSALAVVAPDINDADAQTKEAAMFSKGVLANMVGRGVATTPEVVKTLAAMGVGTGAGIGGLAWYLNRDVKEDNDDLEVMRARIDNYNRITQELTNQLKRSGKYPVTDAELPE